MTTPTLELKSIEGEAADCRAAWAAVPDAAAGLHIHHQVAAEALTEPIAVRITYMLTQKPQRERALRLRLMRPLKAPAWAEYERLCKAAHDVICVEGCPFDGSTIFPAVAP